jgi:hypothetical protein
MNPLEFQDPEVKKGFEMTSPIEKDFKIRIPQLQWDGYFSQLTPQGAEQLIKEKYNHIRRKPK